MDSPCSDDHTVSEYIYELETLYGLVRVTSKCEHVIKLWDRFHKEMQRASGKTYFGKLPPIWGNFLHAFQSRAIGGNVGKYALFPWLAQITMISN